MEGERVEVHSNVDARAGADFYRGGTEVLKVLEILVGPRGLNAVDALRLCGLGFEGGVLYILEGS